MSAQPLPTLATTPQSPEAEQAVIGALLINPAVFPVVWGIITAGDFFLLRHSYIFEAMEREYIHHQTFDMLTISEQLRGMNQFDACGGMSYLIEVMNNTPTSTNAGIYAELVKRLNTRRRLLEMTDTIRKLAIDEHLDISEIMAQVNSAVNNVSSRHIEQRGRWLSEGLETFFENLKAQLNAPRPLRALTTGLRDLDTLLDGGFEDERLIVLAARPGMGKTALILWHAISAARAGKPVIFHTMEMSEQQCIHRLVAMISGVPTTRQKRPKQLTRDELEALARAKQELSGLEIYIEDAPRPTPRDIESRSEWLVKGHDAALILVDGIYRMQSTLDTRGDDTKRYSAIAEDLKNIARTLRVPVVATHQLNRGVEDRADKRPMLSDLRQSGRIEEEADIVLFLYRHEYYQQTRLGEADIIAAKYRDGQVGYITTEFVHNLTLFKDRN